MVAAVKVWLEVRLLALIIGEERGVLCGKLGLLDIPKPMTKFCRWCCRINVVVLIWFFGVFFLNVLDPAAVSFLSSSESLAILSDRYSSTVFQPPGDLSGILIILFRVSKSAIAFLMPFNDFLVKLFLIWRVIDSSCAMMESLKTSWSWLPLYLRLS